MNTPRTPTVLAWLACLLLASGAQAQGIAAGLWEFKQDIRMPGQPDMAANVARMQQQLQQQMKNLPPHMRDRVEQQMAGMGVGLGQGGALRMCVSPEDAGRGPVREGHKEGECTYSQIRQSGNTWSGQVNCTQPPGRGEFSTTIHTAKHYSTKSVLHSQQGRIDMSVDARHVGADCGGLAPVRSR